MTLTTEQEKIVQQAFMVAMARKLYREGVIDTHKLNRLVMKIEKVTGGSEKRRP